MKNKSRQLKPTPETDAAEIAYNQLKADEVDAAMGMFGVKPKYGTPNGWKVARKIERERDEAREELKHIAEYGTEEINAAVELRPKLASALIERDEAREDAAHWKTEYAIVAARLCGKKHPRDNGIISEHEIIPKIERERDNWEQTAADYWEGMHYYRELVERVGEALGEAAYTQDDGGKVDSVLCAKVPELVVDLKRERDEAREERDIARLEFEEISNDLKDSRNRIWQLEKQIEGLNNFANECYEEIQSVRKERDEAREALRRIVNCSANARRVEADYAEWEKAVFSVLDICKEWEEGAK